MNAQYYKELGDQLSTAIKEQIDARNLDKAYELLDSQIRFYKRARALEQSHLRLVHEKE